MKISEKTQSALEWNLFLDSLAARCDTNSGRDFTRRILSLPEQDVKRRMQEILQLKEIRTIENDSVDLSLIADIRAHVRLASKGSVLSIEEIAEVKNFLAAQEGIQRFLRTHKKKYPALGLWDERVIPLRELEALLRKSITDYGSLSRNQYPKLGMIEDEIASLRAEIEKRLNSLLSDNSVRQVLQEKTFTTRSGRYVLPLKAGSRGKIRGTVHDISSSESTIYIEPESISELNNRVIEKEHELKAEINRILLQITREIAAHAEEILANVESIAELDFLNAASKMSELLHAHAPEVVKDAMIDLIEARHPLLALMDFDATVPNSIKLGGEKRCLLISGANTGGKTVFLKTVGFCALLAAHGLHIPASADSRIGLFGNIFVDIGDEQNLSQSLSTFSAQLMTIREMLEGAGEGSLVLIDEIIVGTDPRQGAALARAILEKLAETGAFVLATTHYSELKKFASSDPRFINASVSFDADTLAPTYRLLRGIPGASHALEIAKRYGIPPAIVDRARMLLDESELSAEALIEKVQMLDEELHRERELISQLKSELESEKRELESNKKEIKILQARKDVSAGREFLNEIERLRNKLLEKEKNLREADYKKIAELRNDLAEAEHHAREAIDKAELELHRADLMPFDAKSERVGAEVFVFPLKNWGRVEEVDYHKKTAVVVMGNSLKSRFSFHELFVRRHADTKKKTAARKENRPGGSEENFIPLTIQTSYNTVDLRGKRADEALNLMNDSLDLMTRSGIRCAVIIHGHGTGALKEAVRSALKFSSYVSAFRPGEMGEGGDGVTIALLRD